MYSHAQPRAFSATLLLFLAAGLRNAAHRVRAAASRLDERIVRRPQHAGAEAAMVCEACSSDGNDARELESLAHLNTHVLKDIGAPHWLVAHAAGESDREQLRWVGLDHR
jgi:hypothetical protein